MKLKHVFGVSRDPVASYIERESVDASLAAALTETQQIIIYGSSKQGKTSLLQRHLSDDKRVTVHCGPTTTAETSIVRSCVNAASKLRPKILSVPPATLALPFRPSSQR